MNLLVNFLVNPSNLITLFFALIAASYIVIPVMGTIVISFGAFAPNVAGLIRVMAIVYAATLIGDISIFFIARAFSKPVLKFLRNFRWYNKNEGKARALLSRYEFYMVFLSRFSTTEISLVINYISGFERLNPKKFILAVVLGEFVYAVSYPLLGYIFRDTWKSIIGLIQGFIWIILLAILLIYLLKKFIQSTRKKNRIK